MLRDEGLGDGDGVVTKTRRKWNKFIEGENIPRSFRSWI